MKVSWTNKKGDIFIGDIKELKERFAIVINQDKKEIKLPYLKLTEYKEAINKADIVVFLVAHREFLGLKIKGEKIIMDFSGVNKK